MSLKRHIVILTLFILEFFVLSLRAGIFCLLTQSSWYSLDPLYAWILTSLVPCGPSKATLQCYTSICDGIILMMIISLFSREKEKGWGGRFDLPVLILLGSTSDEKKLLFRKTWKELQMLSHVTLYWMVPLNVEIVDLNCLKGNQCPRVSQASSISLWGCSRNVFVFVSVYFFVFVFVLLLSRWYLLITLIKCIKGHRSRGSNFVYLN